MSKLEKMPKEELVNVLSILLKYDPQLKDYDIEFGPEAVNIRLNGQPCGGITVRNIYDAYERVGNVSQIADSVKDCILRLKPQSPQAHPSSQMGQQPEMPKKEPVIIEVKASRVMEILEEMNSGTTDVEYRRPAAAAKPECFDYAKEEDPSGTVSRTKINQENQNDFLTNTTKQQVNSNEFSLDDDDDDDDDDVTESGVQTTPMVSTDGPEVAPAACDSVNFTPAQEAKEDTKKSSNPQAGMGLKDVLSAALGVPEAGSEEAEAAAKAEEDRFAL